MLSDGAACSLCQVINGHGNVSCIQPRSLIGLPLCYITTTTLKKKKKEKKNTIFSFNPGMQGGVGKCVGRERHLYGFLLSLNFENSLLPMQDCLMHVKTQF